MALEELREGDDSARAQLVAAQERFETMRGEIDNALTTLAEEFDALNDGAVLDRIHSTLNRRRYISNLVREVDKARQPFNVSATSQAAAAADLLDHVFVGVSVTAECLDAGVGRCIAGFGRHVLCDRTLGVEAAFNSGVDAFRCLFDIGARGFQSRDVRHDEFVRVSLCLRERRTRLNALDGIRNGAIECGPSSAQPKGRHHQARVAEHGLRLIQSLAFHATHKPVGIDIDVVERQRRRVAEANAMLIFRFVVRETFRALVDNEPTRSAGSVG